MAANTRADVPPGPAAASDALQRWWPGVHRACGPASSVRALVDVGASPLAALLGYRLARARALADELWLVRLEAADVSVPLLVTGWAAPLDSAWRAAVRLSLTQHARWCLLYNGTRLRLLDAGRTFARRHVEFDLETVADHEDAAWFLVHLAGADSLRLTGDAGSGSRLDRVVALSDAHGQRVCAALGHGVQRAVEHLLAAIAPLDARRRRSPHRDLAGLYDQSLTAVYRLLFLCFAEARSLVPAWHPWYRAAYTMESLRQLVERDPEPRGAWETFQAMSRLAHEGCTAGDLQVTAFNGRLFAPARAPLLEAAAVSDARVREAVLALTTAPAADGLTRDRIAYHDLGVEELGAVYERLLEYEPAVTSSPGTAGTAPASGRRWSVVLTRTATARRKATGTFYTPRRITEYIVRQALEPLTSGVPSHEILRLRVLDPAMGSGAFLVAACRYLARRYEAALVAEGACHTADLDDRDRAGFRRLVAQRCLFGVDLNPMAVHLARLSIWLTTLAADRPLTFLDHHLVSGDSLLGAAPTDITRRHPGRPGPRAADARQLPLFDPATLQGAVSAALPVRERLERMPDDSAAAIRLKETELSALADTGALQAWRTACDLWCGAWFQDEAPSRSVFEALVHHVLRGEGPLSTAVVAAALDKSHATARSAGFFHWPLEFPEVYFEGTGRPSADPGFDAVIGNPPWEMLRRDGAGADAGGRPGAHLTRVLRFTRASGVYHLQSHGHANQYQLFTERALTLARRGGRVGLVLPSGVLTDQGSAPLRRRLIEGCALDPLIGFENSAGIFPIHRSLRFVLLIGTRGPRTDRVRCHFGLTDPAALDHLAEGVAGGWADTAAVSFTPVLLERLSGPGLAIPDFRSAMDLQVAEKLARLHPALASQTGWNVRFGRELNATEDRRYFTTPGPGRLPVVEGKHVSAFAVDSGAAPLAISGESAAHLLDPAATFLRARLAFRDVAGATNRTTLIAAIVPAGCVTTHTLFCLRSRLRSAEQLVLCALFNSYVANFLVRLRVSTHVTLAIVDLLPVPRPAHGSPQFERLRLQAQSLVADPRDAGAGAALQAEAAAAYDLSAAEFEHVLASFPLVPQAERAAALAAFTRGRQR